MNFIKVSKTPEKRLLTCTRVGKGCSMFHILIHPPVHRLLVQNCLFNVNICFLLELEKVIIVVSRMKYINTKFLEVFQISEYTFNKGINSLVNNPIVNIEISKWQMC